MKFVLKLLQNFLLCQINDVVKSLLNLTSYCFNILKEYVFNNKDSYDFPSMSLIQNVNI